MLAGYQSHLVNPVEPGELIAAVAMLAGRTSNNPERSRRQHRQRLLQDKTRRKKPDKEYSTTSTGRVGTALAESPVIGVKSGNSGRLATNQGYTSEQ